MLIARLLGIPRHPAKARAQDLLREFRLDDAAARAVKTYSGGMRRRLDLAASLVGNPRILFLDEPTTGLDPVARLDMWDLVRLLVADGVTVLLTTQYLDEADELCDDLVVIDHGKVIATGSPDQLKSQVGAQSLELLRRICRRPRRFRDTLSGHFGVRPSQDKGVSGCRDATRFREPARGRSRSCDVLVVQ